MMKACAESIELLEKMAEKGSVMLISDVGCGALLCRAAMESAALNVFINTKSLKERSKAARIEAEVDDLLAGYLPRAAAVAESVTRRIMI
jgi:formiminotetrahydrofolate cyclodeaminase